MPIKPRWLNWIPILAIPLLLAAQGAVRAPDLYTVEFRTTAGNFSVQVHRDWAPLAADRFYELVRSGYFTGAAFYRVVPDFVAQWGMSPDPRRSQYWQQRPLADDTVRVSNSAGTISFAASGPHSRTSQVFINLGDNKRLDKQGFAPFGRVVTGWTVVRELESEYGERPDQRQILKQGAAYLTKNFPRLDVIYAATLTAGPPP